MRIHARLYLKEGAKDDKRTEKTYGLKKFDVSKVYKKDGLIFMWTL